LFSRARWRLTLWFAGAFAIILILIGGAVYVTERTTLMNNVDSDLQVRSQRLLDSATGRGPGIFDPEQRGAFNFATVGGYFYVITGPQGNVFSASESANQVTLPTVTELSDRTANGPTYIKATTDDGEQVRLYARSVAANNGQTYYFQVGRSIQPELHALRRLLVISFGGGVIGLILAAAGGYWLAGRALKPIRATMDAQRAFIADASHELRTPLSLIRANAEMMQRHPEQPPDKAFVEDIISETDRLAYLVSQLLTLARSDAADAPFEKAPVDVNHLAGDVTRQMRLLAGEKHIALNFHPNGAATVVGDEQRLGELLLILLDNSVKYTDAGGAVDVSVAQANGRVEIKVTDSGVGIPPEAVAHVFDRFYRADKARSREMGGSGLGLAIARWIAEKHGGRISLDSEPGKGTNVTVDLPSA
jgi:signal transduction histidine kinase